jgi:hypothetical protein
MHFNRIRIIGLALVAVFAMSAVGVSTASASAPEFVRCAKVVTAGTGTFENSTCTTVGAGTKNFIKVFLGGTSISATEECAKVVTAGTGTFENSTCTTVGAGTKNFIEVLKPKLKFTDKEAESHLNAPNTFVWCKADTSKGEITGAKTVAKVSVIFTECEAENKKTAAKCAAHSSGKVSTIETESLKGMLGEVAVAEAPNTKTGLSLEPEGTKGFVTIEATCLEPKTTQVSGSVIGEVIPVGGPPALEAKLVFECAPGEPTKQKIQKFVGVAKDTLSAFGGAACFESIPDTITYEEPIEVT